MAEFPKGVREFPSQKEEKLKMPLPKRREVEDTPPKKNFEGRPGFSLFQELRLTVPEGVPPGSARSRVLGSFGVRGHRVGFSHVNVAVVIRTVLRSHFGVGEFTAHFRTYFRCDWDVHCNYDLDFYPCPCSSIFLTQTVLFLVVSLQLASSQPFGFRL